MFNFQDLTAYENLLCQRQTSWRFQCRIKNRVLTPQGIADAHLVSFLQRFIQNYSIWALQKGDKHCVNFAQNFGIL
jgi:hypothetical protein